MRNRSWVGVLALTVGLAATAASAAEWPNWRGPSYNGSSEETGLPVKFSRTEGVKWATPLPGPSAATPAVWGNSVFVTSTDMQQQKLLVYCLDRTTGKVKWQKDAGTGYRPAGKGSATQIDERSNYASPSPVTDGKRVIFFFGNGDLLAYDFQGNTLWTRNIQKDYGDFCFNWTFGSSPQLFEGKLYFQVLQRDLSVGGKGKDGSDSFLMALDPANGKQLWKVNRPCPAKMESREAYSTPIPYVHDGRKEILVAGGDILTGHDAATGKELWRWGTWNQGHARGDYRLVPSAIGGGGVVLGCGPKREPVFAIKAGLNGDVTDTGLAWKSELRGPVTTDVATPLFYHGKFYVVSDSRKALSCVEPADGKVVWSTPIEGSSVWASPTAADGKVYLLSLTGVVHVVDAASGQVLSSTPMAENDSDIRSSIALAHGCLFIRTNTTLYCVGK
jgi:outer membrane protein assembly factor BamB